MTFNHRITRRSALQGIAAWIGTARFAHAAESPTGGQSVEKRPPARLIFDTDMDSDCDDAGALAQRVQEALQMLARRAGIELEPRSPQAAEAERRLDLLREINQAGMTILLVEQNAQMALSIANRGYVLETGRVVLEGSAADLLADQDLKRAYLGRDYREFYDGRS